MELFQIVILIIAIACFFEYDHLKKNTIRFDELYFFYGGIILLAILFFTLFFETEDIKNIF